MATRPRERLKRLLAPKSIAVAGGDAAAEVIAQCRQLGFPGEIWPVHPSRDDLAGIPCFRSIEELPGVPDAGFVSVPAKSTVDIVRSLAAMGTGGVVCHASGFAEMGDTGSALQADLRAAAGDLALIGPNCIGFLNYLDGVALWPDQHGGRRVRRGVAVLSQSGNIGHNLTMQRRCLPLAQLVTVGNTAVTGVPELIDAMSADSRISAIGLYLEAIDDPAALASASRRALARGVPVIALKSGSSELGARTTLSHTSALATSDALCTALFERAGIARVHDLPTFVETLKFLHVHGPLPGASIVSASCSGGEAAMVADLAAERDVELPEFSGTVREKLRTVLGERVAVANPLDYHTYIWGDADALEDCFTALLSARVDNHLLVLDVPRDDRCRPQVYESTLDCFATAKRATGTRASVVSSLPEGLPESVGSRLLDAGIAPMQGIAECLDAISAAAWIGRARLADDPGPLVPAAASVKGAVVQIDEWVSKKELSAYGIPIPHGELTDVAGASEVAEGIGFPVVLKAVSAGLAHKTEVGAVRLGLGDAESVRAAAEELSQISPRLLVERQAMGALAELIVGVRSDPRFGLALTVGSGGTLVELIGDSATLLLPASREDVAKALGRLRIHPLLTGYRGRPAGDLDALVNAVLAVADYAVKSADRLVELDVNPLLVFPVGQGVSAVDALIRRVDG